MKKNHRILKKISIITLLVGIIFPLLSIEGFADTPTIPSNNPDIVWTNWQQNPRLQINRVGLLVRTDKDKYEFTMEDISIRTLVRGDTNRHVNSAQASFSFKAKYSNYPKINIIAINNLKIIENETEVLVPSDKYTFTAATELNGTGISVDLFDYYSDAIADDSRKITIKADLIIDTEDEISKTSEIEYGVGEKYAIPQLIKAYYYDINSGEEISPKDVYGENGFLNQQESVKKKNIIGYNYEGWTQQFYNNADSYSGNNNGPGALIMTSTRQAITFWYSKQIPAADVTVKFVDEIGNELATTDVLAGNINDPYETSSKEIHGWDLKTTPSNAKGKFTNEPQTVTYIYEKKVAKTSIVDVNYVDENGNELATTDVLTGNIGDPYKTKAKEIDGWELKAIPSNANGVYTDNSQTVTYIYFKRTSDEKFVPPTSSNNETNTEKHKKAFSLSRGSKIEKISNTDNLMEVRLPATGEAQTTENLFIITGILLLSGVIFFLGYQRKSERKN
ncbi:MucBP domain-containing protein [Listeria monocytogenes]|nr:LPXTG cell wall anchor domain-containing protein [Listeria monocytogenes]EAE7928148.1 LPXTG cell wall anchor domain-containing protein [Listeria monocytogenes]EAE8363071.1 LPXTG cell wall anchor domain-containing protein [Listeria monocytogenes]EAG3119450.1 LPXTG cell wall anchor domain-containing protein [Listeria monocytogenes]EAV9838831.1 LPXTG cell wall anchor domain-containing protein [Listeria monocytogenes]